MIDFNKGTWSENWLVTTYSEDGHGQPKLNFRGNYQDAKAYRLQYGGRLQKERRSEAMVRAFCDRETIAVFGELAPKRNYAKELRK